MKRLIIILAVIIVAAGAGVVGWAIRGTQVAAPATTTATSNGTGTDITGSSTGNVSTGTSSSSDNTACTTGNLAATVRLPDGGSAAGSRYYELTVANTASSSCTLNGYPGVSLVDQSGAIVGSPADKDTSKGSTAFTLDSGEKATATLHVAVSDNFSAGTCKDGAMSVKIYPPNDTNYLTVTSSIASWCPGFTTTAFVKS